MKVLIRNKTLYESPKSDAPPPWWIRGTLIADLHRRVLRPRRQRRPEGHGPDHADPDRRGADGLCAQPDHERRGDAGLHREHPQGRGRARRPRARNAPRSRRRRRPEDRSTRDLRTRRSSPAPPIYAALSDGRVRHRGAARRPTARSSQVPAADTPNLRNEMYLESDALRADRQVQVGAVHQAGEGDTERPSKASWRVAPASSQPGSRSPWPWRSASAQWWGGSGSWSPSARGSANST